MKGRCIAAFPYPPHYLLHGEVYELDDNGCSPGFVYIRGQRSSGVLFKDRFEILPEPGPDPNPKKAFGDIKPQLALIPPAAERACAGALALGASKYGEFNWRHNPVEIMTYLHAMKRHIAQVLDGEDIDPESGHPHLGHVMASAAIVIDCADRGTLIENRPPKKENKP